MKENGKRLYWMESIRFALVATGNKEQHWCLRLLLILPKQRREEMKREKEKSIKLGQDKRGGREWCLWKQTRSKDSKAAR